MLVAFVSAASQKVLDVPGGSQENGVQIQQWDGNSNPQQHWQVEPTGNGLVKIRSAASQKVLDVPGGLQENGIRIQQWDDNGNPQQHWQVEPIGNGLVKIRSAASQKVLDVPGGSQENGVRIQQWDDNGNPQQHWQVVPIGKPNFPIPVQRYDYLAGMHIDVDSSATLYADGRVVTVTQTHERLDLTGGHAGVQILFYDANQHHLWDTDARRYGVDGKWIGQSDREDTDTQFADPDTMGQVAYVAIKHFESPNGLPQDIQNWLAGARQDFNYVAGIVTDIRTIIG